MADEYNLEDIANNHEDDVPEANLGGFDTSQLPEQEEEDDADSV